MYLLPLNETRELLSEYKKLFWTRSYERQERVDQMFELLHADDNVAFRFICLKSWSSLTVRQKDGLLFAYMACYGKSVRSGQVKDIDHCKKGLELIFSDRFSASIRKLSFSPRANQQLILELL